MQTSQDLSAAELLLSLAAFCIIGFLMYAFSRVFGFTHRAIKSLVFGEALTDAESRVESSDSITLPPKNLLCTTAKWIIVVSVDLLALAIYSLTVVVMTPLILIIAVSMSELIFVYLFHVYVYTVTMIYVLGEQLTT